MRVWEAFRMALGALVVNKGRSALTILGVVIGITAVIALLGVGQGAQQEVEERVEGLGSNLLYIRPLSYVDGADPLSADDLEAIGALTNVAGVAPEISVGATVAYQGNTANPTITGTTPSWPTIRNASLAAGRFFSDSEVDRVARVAVIGSDVAQDLGLADSDSLALLGEKIKIGGLPFTVVGILEPRGGMGPSSSDSTVFMPESTARLRMTGEDDYNGISVQVADVELMDEAQAEIEALLRARHQDGQVTGVALKTAIKGSGIAGAAIGATDSGASDDFSVSNQAQLLETASEVTGILTALLAGIAGISLLVGGIGVMNIMLVSVTERTRDIGIRKAIGARSRDIMWQFLIESVLLSLIGGILGVVLGVLLSRLLGYFLDVTAIITLGSVILAAGVAIGIGIFFGVYPARKASRQDPIQALRHE